MLRRLIVILLVLTLANVYVATSFFLTTGWWGVWAIAGAEYFLELLMPLLRYKADAWSRAWPSLAKGLWLVNLISLLALGGFSVVFFFSAIRDLALFALGFL